MAIMEKVNMSLGKKSFELFAIEAYWIGTQILCLSESKNESRDSE